MFYVIVIPIFDVVLILDKDENAINNGKRFVLFHFRSSRAGVFCKRGVLRNLAKFTRKTCARVSFLVKLQASSL